MSFSHVVMLCGGPDIWVRGARLHLAVPARRQSVLALAYLVLGDGRTVAADRLADAAWPKGPPDSWRAGLRRVMSDVRAWLEAGSIDAQVRSVHGTYELVLPPDCTTDVALARDALRRARGGFAAPGEAAAVANVAVNSLANPLLPGYEAPWLSRAPSRDGVRVPRVPRPSGRRGTPTRQPRCGGCGGRTRHCHRSVA